MASRRASSPVVEPALELDHRLVARARPRPARVKKNFSIVLQRVRLDAGAQALADDLEQVDEHLAAQQLVDLLLARRVRAHQPRERRGLVGGVVVDVHVRDTRAGARGRGRRTPRTRAAPRRGRGPRTARYVAVPSGSRQSTPNRNSSRAAGSKNGSPSMSKKTSPGEGAGRRPSPRRSSRLEQVVGELAGAVAVELQPGLVAQPLEHRRREPRARARSGGDSARPVSVVTSTVSSLPIWSRRIDATRVRWSSSFQRSRQTEMKSQREQWSQGHG